MSMLHVNFLNYLFVKIIKVLYKFINIYPLKFCCASMVPRRGCYLQYVKKCIVIQHVTYMMFIDVLLVVYAVQLYLHAICNM
jgi:hypothetical protein